MRSVFSFTTNFCGRSDSLRLFYALLHVGTLVLCVGYKGALFSILATTFRPSGLTYLDDLLTFDGQVSGFGYFFQHQLMTDDSQQSKRLRPLADR